MVVNSAGDRGTVHRYVRRDLEQEPDDEGPPGSGSWQETIRTVAGIGLVVALALVALVTLLAVRDAAEPSAVQLIQLYAEGAFYAITAIGAAIGIYIATRADE